jgi:1-acyl-sn-glycerol-3-phosphate acyltransferase
MPSPQPLPPTNARTPQPVRKWLGRAFLHGRGWQLAGRLPDCPKFVLISYPHTSNWDFVHLLAISWAMEFQVSWVGKQSLFKFPFGGLMKRLGGIPVVRNQAQGQGQVEQVVQKFRDAERLVVAIAPEGTRKYAPGWKTGFYNIAVGAGVPLQLGFLDYTRKVGGFGPVVMPTGDLERDMETLRVFYADVAGKFMDQAGRIEILRKAG